jgi:hypothetical protein
MSADVSEPFTRSQPVASALTQPFWDATRIHVFLLQHCRTCGRSIHYPRAICPHCHSSDIEWRESPGSGSVYAFTVENRPKATGFGEEPYVIALIELAEGVRLVSNIVGSSPTEVTIGQAVRLDWVPLADGSNLPVFRLTDTI